MAPGALSLGVSPVFNLNNFVHNDTSLVLNGNVDVSAIGGSLEVPIFDVPLDGTVGGPIKIGPLFQDSASEDFTTIPLYSNDFSVNINSLTSSPFNIAFSNSILCRTTVACGRGGFIQSDGTVYQVSDLYDLFFGPINLNLSTMLSNPANCLNVDGLGPICIPDGDIVSFLLGLSDTTAVANTSLFATTVDGQSFYFNNPSILIPGDPLSVPNNTDAANAALLASLGFVDAFPPLDLPTLAEVPEPSTRVLLAVGIAALVCFEGGRAAFCWSVSARRRRRHHGLRHGIVESSAA
jgi:hypothetical protein